MDLARVLFIYEKDEVAQTVEQALEDIGIHVDTVHSAHIAREPHSVAAYRVVILDPGGSSEDLFMSRMLRPVVRGALLLCTHSKTDVHLLQAYDIGVDECITLPIKLPLLVAKVTAWCRRANRMHQNARL